MNRYLLLVSAFFLLNVGHGQEPYAEFQIESNKIHDLQAFEVHDSVFLTYTDKDVRRAFWIDGQGKANQVYLNHVAGARICGIQKQPDTTFIYYLKEEDRLLRLFSLKQPSHGGNVYSGGTPLNISGDLMAVQANDRELILVYYLKKSNRIEILSIKRGVKTGFIELQMPEDFARYASSSGLITEDGLTTISQGSAPTKIYREGNGLIFTIDEDRSTAGKSDTKVIHLDLSTGKYAVHAVPGTDNGRFTSFYHGGKLFRFTASTGKYEWSAYNIQTGATLYTKTVNQEKSLRDQRVLLRTAESQEVRFGHLRHIMDQFAAPVMIVEKIPGAEDLRFVTGTFQNSKGAVIVGGISPLAVLAGLVVANVINQLEGPPGIQQYFYLTGNVDKGFDFEPFENISAPSVRQIIDQYEISKTSGVGKNEEKWSWFLLHKGYLGLNDGGLGIYHEKRKHQNRLILLKYKRTASRLN